MAYFGEKNPVETAQKQASTSGGPYFAPGHATGAFVNYSFSEAFFQETLEESLKPDFGSQSPVKKNPFLVEYSQPNPGKPMHLGHIRSTLIGDVCSRAILFSGSPVVRLNYLNDRGAHIAELITALEEFKDLPKVKNERDLLAYYVKIKKEIEENPLLKEKTRNVLEHLKDHQKQLKKIRQLSWTAFERNYKALDVQFDAIPLESELEDDALKAVKECLKKGLAKKEADGTIITQLEPDISNTVLLRSNGTPLYFTSDLALADWKWEKYGFSKSMIFTASEQNLHFRQLKLLLKKMGRSYADVYDHKGHGLIKLSEGKMSTRQGRVILLEDVLSDVIEEAKRQVEAKGNTTDVERTAKGLGIGALKFGVLRISLPKDITFDPQKEVQFEGGTASYVQYAHVRACGILEKAEKKGTNEKTQIRLEDKRKRIGKADEPAHKKNKNSRDAWLSNLPKTLSLNDSEKELIKKIAEFPEIVEHVAEQLEPHVLCDYSLALARSFTRFYDQSPVMTAETEELKNQRILLVAAAKNTLGLCLKLLGIKALERM